MRLAQIVDTLYWGGVQELLVTLAAAAQQSNLHITIISLHGEMNTPYLECFKKMGIPVVMFPARKLTDPFRLYRLTRFLHQERFDLVQSHLLYANVLGGIAARLAGIPILGTLHFDKFEHPPRRQKLEALVLRYTSSVILAVGYHVASIEQQRLPGKQISVIPNCLSPGSPLSPEQRLKIRTEFVNHSGELLLISVGRLTAQKGFADLVEAAVLWREAGLQFQLIIVGDGPMRARLQAQIDELCLRSNITLIGFRSDARQLMAASDIYICSSHWEGLSISVLEAMAAGLPIVATDISDVSLLFGTDRGLVVPAHCPQKLAEAVQFLFRHPEAREIVGAATQQYVEQNHNSSHWFNQLQLLYKVLLTTSEDS